MNIANQRLTHLNNLLQNEQAEKKQQSELNKLGLKKLNDLGRNGRRTNSTGIY